MLSPTTQSAADVAGIVERYRAAEARLHRRRQAACGPSATDTQALTFIYAQADRDEPCSAKQLADHLEITPASTTAVIDRLEGVGLVTREPSTRDRRSIRIVPVNRTADPNRIDPLSERIATLTATLDHDRARVIRDFLDDLIALVDDECTDERSRSTGRAE